VSRARDRIAWALATWFGCGLVPLAPGTAGSAGAIPLYLLLRPYGPAVVLAAALVVTLVGVAVASRVAAITREKDPQRVVIDEVAGMLVTLAPAPLAGWRAVVAGFVLFRVCDQLKPWPARLAEHRLRGGWGIVLDDVAAGVWAAAGVGALRAGGVL
jgi:phosphatidylglycerophosphatase A